MEGFPRFWAKVIEIAILTAPFLALIFGIDVTPGVDGLAEIGVHLGALIIAVKDFIQLIKGYTDLKDVSLSNYAAMSYFDFERAIEAESL